MTLTLIITGFSTCWLIYYISYLNWKFTNLKNIQFKTIKAKSVPVFDMIWKFWLFFNLKFLLLISAACDLTDIVSTFAAVGFIDIKWVKTVMYPQLKSYCDSTIFSSFFWTVWSIKWDQQRLLCRGRSNSVHVHFGTPGYTTSVHDQFRTPEVQFGTRQILECNFGTPQVRFRYTFRSFSVH